MVQVWGKVPEYKGRGRPPEKKRPQDGWKYLQVIKERDEAGRVTGTKKKSSSARRKPCWRFLRSIPLT
jgi:hypothetical protein